MDFYSVLSELTGLSGPAGREEPVTRRAETLLKPLVDRVETDRMGNLFGYKSCGREHARTVLLDAHLDEIGFIVTGHDKGFVRFGTLGRIDPRILPDQKVRFAVSPALVGVVACLPPHVQDSADYDRVTPAGELLIDTGLAEDEAKALLPVGTFGTFEGECFPLGDEQISGRALDDRAGFAVLLRVMELLRDRSPAVNVVVCGSVQEEVGHRGAKTAAFAVDPDACVVVDVTYGRTPDAPKDRTFEMGGGPCIGLGPNCHRGMAAALRSAARDKNIPFQLEVMEGNTHTNGWAIQVARSGVATAIVSIPLKYMHSPVETVHRDDLENTAQLIAGYLVSKEAEM